MTYGVKTQAAVNAVTAVPATAKDESPANNSMSTGFILGLPAPPSVNRMMGKLGNKSPKVVEWATRCNHEIMMIRPKPKAVTSYFTVDITWDDSGFGRFDIDNRIKPLMDYLQRVELIPNDKFCWQLTAKWGPASMGCIVKVAPVGRTI